MTKEDKRAAEVQEAAEEVIETLAAYRVTIWGDVLAAVTSAIFAAKIDAAEIEREEVATRALLLAPEMTADLTGATKITVKIEGKAVSAGTIVAMAAADVIGDRESAAEG